MSDQPVDSTGAQAEDWTVGYLTDVILTRDTWMHRSDIAAAAGRQLTLTAVTTAPWSPTSRQNEPSGAASHAP